MLPAAAVLLLAFVAVVVLLPTRAGADPKVVPHTSGHVSAHDVAGFPGTSTTAPFNECPAIGYDNSCGLLIVVSNNGEAVLEDPNNQASGVPENGGTQQPYDDIEDTLVGIVNESSKPLFAIQLSGESTSTPIFGFDGDGICTYATGGSASNGTGSGGAVGDAARTSGGLHGRRILHRLRSWKGAPAPRALTRTAATTRVP